MKKRIFMVLLTVVLLMAAAVCAVQAEEPTCPCCDQKLSEITWQTWTTTSSTGFSTGGHYKLPEGGVSLTGQVKFTGGTIVLDLAGQNMGIDASKTGRAMYVQGGTVHILDSVGGGSVYGRNQNTGCTAFVNSSGTLNIHGGTITSIATAAGSSNDRDTIRVNGGKVNIYGGTVEGNAKAGALYVLMGAAQVTVDGGTVNGGSRAEGGAAYVSNGKLTVKSGSINASTTATKGSAVYVATAGELEVTGTGVVDGSNVTKGSGTVGTVYSDGTVTVSGGEVKGASAGSGGSIFVNAGALTVSGGKVSGGQAANYGDDIFVNNAEATVDISGGEVAGQFQISNAKTVTVSGKPVLGELKLPEGVDLTLGELTGGADICIAALDGAFTLENENAKNYVQYFRTNSTDKAVICIDNVLTVGDAEKCPHCGEFMPKIEWKDWNAATAKTTSGHYRLTADVKRSAAQFAPESGVELVIDLAGYDFTATGKRAFYLDGAKLWIMDTAGTGTVSGTAENTLDKNGGVYCLVNGGEVTMYGGRSYANGDGDMGAVAYVGNSSTLTVTGTAVLDGNGKAGPVIYAKGTVLMDSGTVENGSAEACYLDGGTMTMSGGDIIVPAGMGTGNAIYGKAGAILQLTGTSHEAYHSSMPGNVLVLSDSTLEAALGASVVNRYGRQFWFATNFQAVSNYHKVPDMRCIRLFTDKAVALSRDSVTVGEETYDLVLDVNGHTVKVTVNEGVTFRGMDSTATTTAEGTGKAILISAVEGGTVAVDRDSTVRSKRYITLTDEQGDATFHQLAMRITTASVRSSVAGMYYISEISCDPTLGQAIDRYGVAVSLAQMPGDNFTAENSKALYTETRVTPEKPFENGANTSVLIQGIFEEDAAEPYLNSVRGKMPIYANGYICVNTGDGELLVMSDTENQGKTTEDADFDGVGYSLYDILKLLDDGWSSVSEADRTKIQNFYDTWVDNDLYKWSFQNIKMFRAGFGRSDITPNFAVHMGAGNDPNRIYDGSEENILDRLYVNCVAITDTNDETVLLITQDLTGAAKNYTTEARRRISEATLIPEENILISATHTHSAPDTANYGTEESNRTTGVAQFRELYFTKVVEAAQAALADRSYASAASGTAVAKTTVTEYKLGIIPTNVEKDMVFVRRYIQKDGGYRGGNGHNPDSALVDSVYDANNTMQIIEFTRPLAEKDILFTNLGVHATFNGTTTQMQLSADFPGALRQQVEASGKYWSAHFISGGADQNPESDISAEKHNLDYKEYGKCLGQIALDAVDSLTAVKTGEIAMASETVVADGNVQDILQDKAAGIYETRLADAKTAKEIFNATGFTDGEAKAKELGFKGIYHALGYISRSSMAETRAITISTLAFGDVSFVLAPYEMFGCSAAELIEESPYTNTFVITCCNGADGYMPVEEAYAYGCYESYTSYVAPGTAETLVDRFVALLTGLKKGA